MVLMHTRVPIFTTVKFFVASMQQNLYAFPHYHKCDNTCYFCFAGYLYMNMINGQTKTS